jgi:hypothetical protein
MTFAPGQLHSVLWHGDGTYNVAKILVVDEGGLHVRVYAELFEDRPSYVPDDLEVGSPYDGGAFGVGHIPVTVAQFERWEPQHITDQDVDDSELDGYRHWRDEASDTGYFDETQTGGGVISKIAGIFKGK